MGMKCISSLTCCMFLATHTPWCLLYVMTYGAGTKYKNGHNFHHAPGWFLHASCLLIFKGKTLAVLLGGGATFVFALFTDLAKPLENTLGNTFGCCYQHASLYMHCPCSSHGKKNDFPVLLGTGKITQGDFHMFCSCPSEGKHVRNWFFSSLLNWWNHPYPWLKFITIFTPPVACKLHIL